MARPVWANITPDKHGKAYDTEMFVDPEVTEIARWRENADGDVKYTPQQQAQIDNIDAAIDEVDNRDDWTQAEKARAIQSLENQKSKIIPKGTKEKSPFPQGQNVGDTWTHEGSGVLLTRDPDGKVRSVYEPKDKGDKNDIIKTKMEAFKTVMSLTNENGLPLMNPKDAKKFVDEMFSEGQMSDYVGVPGAGIPQGQVPQTFPDLLNAIKNIVTPQTQNQPSGNYPYDQNRIVMDGKQIGISPQGKIIESNTTQNEPKASGKSGGLKKTPSGVPAGAKLVVGRRQKKTGKQVWEKDGEYYVED